MAILAIILAIVSFVLCFIIWAVPFIGPLFVIGLSIAAIVLSIITMVSISNYNKRNILNQDFNPQKSTRPIIAAIISGASLVIAIIFFILHLCVFINFVGTEYPEDDLVLDYEMNQGVTEVEYGVAYEIEDHIYLTIDSAVYEDNFLNIQYSISNDGNKQNVFYLGNFYYTSSENIDAKIYPYKNTMMPIYIDPDTVYVSEVLNIEMDSEPDTIGYDSLSGESIVIDVE